jgi:hypothetical protein
MDGFIALVIDIVQAQQQGAPTGIIAIATTANRTTQNGVRDL